MVWDYLLSASFFFFSQARELMNQSPLVSEHCGGGLSGAECHCRQQNQVRVSNQGSAERRAVQSQQCFNFVTMGRITLIQESICAFTFKKK